MNAQEAIERVEEMKRTLGLMNFDKETIEALSIVLESAKVLHKLVEDGEAIVKGSLLGVYYQDNTVHIPEELAENLGIEVEK